MPERGEEMRPDDDEVGGGAVKSFLEHLEDLRWMLIKSAAATLVGMLLCLFGIHTLVSVLKWPLERARARHLALFPPETNQVVTMQFGEWRSPPVQLKTNRMGTLIWGQPACASEIGAG